MTDHALVLSTYLSDWSLIRISKI